jgi:pullulanase-type alpha-1,6-glucosidase
VVTWAREYKVDGFRFDLMGHHSKENMLEVRRALDRVDRDIYVYGEGWNFGEVMDNARFVQASQLNMAGTGIGTFSDRLRDAVRGGGPFDEDPRQIRGFASGLAESDTAADRARLLLYHDQIKVGLAGNLRDYRFVDRTGTTVTGAQVDYNGQPAGYAAEPDETITYVDAHDNETLFDILQYKLPLETSMKDRVRMNTVALSTVALGQSPAFWHAGTDLLRSKSLDRNSYNSGDWFNRIDWTATESTWGSGLPPAEDNVSKWPYMQPLLALSQLEPSPADIRTARDRAAELLRIRFSSPLFRLGSAREIQRRVSFPTGGPDQTPGVIVMAIEGRRESIVVVFNARSKATEQSAPTKGRYALHPVQAHGGDPVVRQSTASRGRFTVPARTTAVFVSRTR